MATDPPAPDLGAMRPALEVFLDQLATWRAMEAGQIRALLAAYDAQAARLANAAEMGKVLDALRADLAAVKAERDRERDGWVRCTEMRLAAEQRATRLVALEQECRAYLERHQFADAGIAEAVEALDAPPGGSA